ncbi:hypothetical protein FACS1894186_6050 [Alphaproteobacteria bacterium]|nr:hypothetical protein FACS1894186_6050 [Alphaproteobacteria bacterium]
MQIKVSGQRISVGNSLAEYAQGKAGAAVAKYYEDARGITVAFSKEGGSAFVLCRILAAAGAGADFSAEAQDTDAYRAFDLALGKLESQLAKAKEKNSDRRHK